MADNDPSYPLFDMEPGATKLNLRLYPCDAEASRTNDIAACAATLVGEGFDVVVGASHTPSMVTAIGLGWREPLLSVFHARSTLEVTAALYTAWGKGRGRGAALVIEDWMSLSTRPGGGHDDVDGLDWLRAVRNGDARRLEELTGLSYSGYLRRSEPPAPGASPMVIGGRYRNGGNGPTLEGVMGGRALVELANIVVGVSADPAAARRHDDGTEMVVGTAALLKPEHRARSVEVARPLERPHTRWAAAA